MSFSLTNKYSVNLPLLLPEMFLKQIIQNNRVPFYIKPKDILNPLNLSEQPTISALSPNKNFKTPCQNFKIELKPRSKNVISLQILNSEIAEGICPSNILNPQLLLAKAIVKVNEGKALTTILNVSDETQYVDPISVYLEPLDQNDATVFAMPSGTTKKSSSRLKLLRDNLRLDHLNPEEKHDIVQLCSDYNDIFFLPNDIIILLL